MKRALSLLLAALLGLALFAACASSGDAGSPAAASPGAPTGGSAQAPAGGGDAAPFVIGFSNVNDIYPYCIKFRNYMIELAEAEGMTVLVADAANDADRQNGQVDNFIVQGADVVTIIAVDQDGNVPAVEAVRTAGLPFVAFIKNVRDEGGYPEGYIYIGSDHYDAGYIQGQFLCEVLPENAVILYATGAQNSAQYAERRQGLLDGLADRPDLVIASEMTTNNTKDLGITVTEDWMQVYDRIDCVVGQNDDSVLGVIEALKAAGRLDGVVTVGLDGSDDGLASIRAGEMTMSVLQDAYSQAVAGVEVFKQLRDGADPATLEDVVIPYRPITAENVDEYAQ